jgi:hypothetical protein
MVAVVGLLYSFGLILAQRRSLQTAADAASLSGSWQVLRELASDNRSDVNVQAATVSFATANGVPADGTPGDATYLSAVYVDATGAQLSPSTAVGSGNPFPAAARGVRVTVSNQVPTVLPNFLRVWQVLVQNSATSVARPTSPPISAANVVPVGVSWSTARAAYAAHTAYDLFAHPLSGGEAPTLNFVSNGAPTFGLIQTNLQYWSDGQHSGAWLLGQPATVNLAGAAYYDSVATGLRNNVRRQALTDSSGAAYALVTVPLYDSSTSTTLHVTGFAQMKIRYGDISSTSALGTFVPYPAAAWGTPVTPTTDIGAAFVGITS